MNKKPNVISTSELSRQSIHDFQYESKGSPNEELDDPTRKRFKVKKKLSHEFDLWNSLHPCIYEHIWKGSSLVEGVFVANLEDGKPMNENLDKTSRKTGRLRMQNWTKVDSRSTFAALAMQIKKETLEGQLMAASILILFRLLKANNTMSQVATTAVQCTN